LLASLSNSESENHPESSFVAKFIVPERKI
jgi:hypothetical protein